MVDLTSLVDAFQHVLSFSAVSVVALPLLGALIALWYDRLALRNDLHKLELQREDLLMRRRRQADQNIDLKATVDLLYRHGQPWTSGEQKTRIGLATDPFVVGTFDLRNTGDGPVDLLACLVAGRELSPAYRTGLGRLGRDVVWSDLKRYYWLDTDSAPLLRGISTTKQMLYATDQLIRLDPAEHETLNRVDYLENVAELYARGHLNLVYKVFVVVLNYPLDVLYDQLQRARRPRRAQLIQSVAGPDFRRWRRIQRALETINSLPFRLALEQSQIEEDKQHLPENTARDYHARDPLGRLAGPTPWRCFLLYHQAFDERYDDYAMPVRSRRHLRTMWRRDPAKETVRPTTEQVRQYITTKSDFNIYEPTLDTTENRNAARLYCYGQLGHLLEAWRQLNDAIEKCDEFEGSFAGLVTAHPGDEYNQRWEVLRQEGYLYRRSMTSFLSRLRARRTHHTLNQQEMWALERYKVGAKYILVTLKAPGHDDPERFPHDTLPSHDHDHDMPTEYAEFPPLQHE